MKENYTYENIEIKKYGGEKEKEKPNRSSYQE